MKHFKCLLSALGALCLLAGTAFPVHAELEETTAETAAQTTAETVPETTARTEPQTTETTTQVTETTTETTTTAPRDITEALDAEPCSSGMRITRFHWLNELTVEIPDRIDGKPVTEIAPHAFQYCFADAVTLPKSLLLLHDEAFAGCAYLREITIPDGCRYIGNRAFADCELLSEIHIPESVTEIGGSAFTGTAFLKEQQDFVILGGGVLCAYLGTADHLTIPDSVRAIAPQAFSGCEQLRAVTVPEQVRSIREYAFEGCTALTQIQLEGIPERLDADAFSRTKWCDEPASDLLIAGSVLWRCTGKQTEVRVPVGVQVINDGAFANQSALRRITLPDSVTEIRSGAFRGCSELRIAELGNGLTRIGEDAFAGNSALSYLRVGNALTAVGAHAFADCGQLSEIHLPDTVTEIGDAAFGFRQTADGTGYEKSGAALTLYSDAEAVKDYAAAHQIPREPLPASEQTVPAPELTETEAEHGGLHLPEGSAWIPAVICGGALVLAAVIVQLLRRMRR